MGETLSKISLALESWIEKQFTFNYPTGAFPALLERLRGTSARLEEMVRHIPPRILTQRVGNDWSIQEHVGHLYDLDELHDGRLDDYDAGLDTLRPADMTNEKTYRADHNSTDIEALLGRFREARTRFVARLEGLDQRGVERAALHPRLNKPMRVIDLAQFVAEHDDHHLASITHVARTLAGQR